MLSISVGSKGSGGAQYYLNLAREDYYLNGGEPPGKWYGLGADALGLRGVVRPEPFQNVFAGCSPDGEAELVQNAGKPERVGAWDLTFSAPKSVSVLWSQALPETQQRVIDAHHRAVEAGLDYLQGAAGLTRRGHGGQRLERAKLIFATFEHGTSRNQDPQLHTHCLVINLGIRADGSTGALWTKELFTHKMAAGALYRTELASQLKKNLGLGIARDGDSFRIEGVPTKLCETFSTRRQEIMRALAERGLSGAVAAKAAALATRQVKQHASRESLFSWWKGVGQAHGWSTKEAERLVSGQQLTPIQTDAPAVVLKEGTSTPAHDTPQTLKEEPKESPRPQQRNPKAERPDQSQRQRTAQADVKKVIEAARAKEHYFKHESDFVRAAAEEAQHHGLSARDVLKAVGRHLGVEVRYKQLFPKAPHWSPARDARLPHLAFKSQPRQPKEKPVILKEAKLLGVKFQIVKERVFPKAPKWSPASRVRLPRIRVVPDRLTSAQRKALRTAKREAKQAARLRAQFYGAGDRVRFDKDAKTLGIQRGQTGQVLAVHKESLDVKLDTGTKLHIPLSAYHSITVIERAKEAREKQEQRGWSSREREAEAEQKATSERSERREKDERTRNETSRDHDRRHDQSHGQSHSL